MDEERFLSYEHSFYIPSVSRYVLVFFLCVAVHRENSGLPPAWVDHGCGPPTGNMVFAPCGRESVREKVYERMVSERKRIAAQFRSEGVGRSAEILGTMEKELRQIRSTAYRRVQEVQGKADAEATQIYGHAFNKDPKFYVFLRTLESYKEKTK